MSKNNRKNYKVWEYIVQRDGSWVKILRNGKQKRCRRAPSAKQISRTGEFQRSLNSIVTCGEW